MNRGRLAPSPTGDLHLGGAATFLVAWLEARTAGAALALRIEDLDQARVQPGSEARLADDLRWLGLDWDEGPDRGGPGAPYRQSARRSRYDQAIAHLASRGLVYLCDCSRAEIARAASAPHAGEEGPRYPGTCRPHGLRPRPWRRPPALRFAVPEGRELRFVDQLAGEQREIVSEATGDFVLRRGDGVIAYQLAVVVDDLAMEVTQVVRGADLLSSTPRQLLLIEALGGPPPAYLHAPLLLGPTGERLAKRARGMPLRDQRAAGRSAEEILGPLAHALGLLDDDRPAALAELTARYQRSRLHRGPIVAPAALTM